MSKIIKFVPKEKQIKTIEIPVEHIVKVSIYKIYDIIIREKNMPIQIIFKKKDGDYRYMGGVLDMEEKSRTINRESDCITMYELIPNEDGVEDYQYRSIRIESLHSVTLNGIHYQVA